MFYLKKNVVYPDLDVFGHELVLEPVLGRAPNASSVARLNADEHIHGNGGGQRERLFEQRRVRQILRLVHHWTPLFNKFLLSKTG